MFACACLSLLLFLVLSIIISPWFLTAFVINTFIVNLSTLTTCFAVALILVPYISMSCLRLEGRDYYSSRNMFIKFNSFLNIYNLRSYASFSDKNKIFCFTLNIYFPFPHTFTFEYIVYISPPFLTISQSVIGTGKKREVCLLCSRKYKYL